MALTLKQALAMFWEQIQVRFVKRENGKGLSTNDFTTEEKNKLAAIQEGAEANVQADFNETDETSMAFIKNKPTKEDALLLAVETELIDPITDENGAIYTDLNGEILSL